MWVVKIGGSLCSDPVLPLWLDLLTQIGGGRVTVVCGGGTFADEVRRVQSHWQFNDLAAHNMAVLAMAQTAYQLHALNPGLQLATRKTDIPDLLRQGKTALWLPLELRRDHPDERTGWDATSDTIALDLAKHLNAEQLVLVKSCAIDPRMTLAELGDTGVLDQQFAKQSDDAAFPITLLHKNQLSTMRALLLGEATFTPR
ncbi:aspartate kinase [Variovorax sp. AFSI2.2]|uniref:amino acid kinase family protein n=1 Tax=Variovorax sp. AFSI2.2 TaxID=3384160 RepID=UPI003EBC246A